MQVEYINPFIESAISVCEQAMNISLIQGKVSLQPKIVIFPDVVVLLGVVGDVKGQVVYGLSEKTAMAVATKMRMGMETDGFDEVARSAISELGNMITGTAAGIFEKNGKVFRERSC